MNSKKEKIDFFNSVLFRWFAHHKRDLPWRRTSDPYAILVSEVMLQQTQVDRVLVKYKEFLKQFPNIKTLADASLGDVLRAWSGLGYNRRAKYLHDCARELMENSKGQIPKTFRELMQLPGIGRSTAAALCSFAFGADEPMIDTNIRRIICRVFFPLSLRDRNIPVAAIYEQQDKIASLVARNDRSLYEFAKKLIPKNKGRDWNWAMMDIGATLCTAQNHDDQCPFQKLHGKVKDFVYKKPQKKFKDSDRYYRGRIIALLNKKSPEDFGSICDKIRLSHERCDELLGQLVGEGLIAVNGGRYVLPQ